MDCDGLVVFTWENNTCPYMGKWSGWRPNHSVIGWWGVCMETGNPIGLRPPLKN